MSTDGAHELNPRERAIVDMLSDLDPQLHIDKTLTALGNVVGGFCMEHPDPERAVAAFCEYLQVAVQASVRRRLS